MPVCVRTTQEQQVAHDAVLTIVGEAAIVEIKNGLARNNLRAFYVEAIVGAHNEPSRRVAAATIADTPKEVTDEFSGLPAFQYLRKVA